MYSLVSVMHLLSFWGGNVCNLVPPDCDDSDELVHTLSNIFPEISWLHNDFNLPMYLVEHPLKIHT